MSISFTPTVKRLSYAYLAIVIQAITVHIHIGDKDKGRALSSRSVCSKKVNLQEIDHTSENLDQSL